MGYTTVPIWLPYRWNANKPLTATNGKSTSAPESIAPASLNGENAALFLLFNESPRRTIDPMDSGRRRTVVDWVTKAKYMAPKLRIGPER